MLSRTSFKTRSPYWCLRKSRTGGNLRCSCRWGWYDEPPQGILVWLHTNLNLVYWFPFPSSPNSRCVRLYRYYCYDIQESLGNAWATEYGDSDNPVDFDFMYPLSPLHNLPKHKVLPPTLLMTADRESFLQDLHLLRIWYSLDIRRWPCCTHARFQTRFNPSAYVASEPPSITHPYWQENWPWRRQTNRDTVFDHDQYFYAILGCW
jgi:hypothetical protein